MVVTVIATLALSTHTATAQVSFQILQPPPGYTGFGPRGISDDGTIIVGSVMNSEGRVRAMRYSTITGAEVMDGPTSPYTTAYGGISGDGQVIGGNTANITFTNRTAFTHSGPSEPRSALPSVPTGYQYFEPRLLTTHGTFIAGIAPRTSDSSGRNQAMRWSATTGYQVLGSLTPFDTVVTPRGMTPDGSVIVGESGSSGGVGAFVWREGQGMTSLSIPAGAERNPRAADVSNNGEIIVGQATVLVGTSPALKPVVWNNQVATILPFRSGFNYGSANYISGDGSTIVGSMYQDGVRHFCIWFNQGDPVFLDEVLATSGLAYPAGYTMAGLFGLSNDGRTVLGILQSTQGQPEIPFIATIPSPCGMGLITLSFVTLWNRGSRKSVRLSSSPRELQA